MCEYCHQSFCPPLCPNAPVPVPTTAFFCDWCDEDVKVGEEYIRVGGERYHTDCYEDNKVEILEELLANEGIKIKSVEAERD